MTEHRWSLVGSWCLAGAVALLVVAASPAAAQQTSFPDYAETEYEQSVITIPLKLEGRTEPVEILKLDAFMRLEREVPRLNGLGYRQFEFTIAQWELYGYSTFLEGWVTFTLSNTIQPKSLGVSLQKETDYPAMIVYSAIYDAYLDGKRIIADQPGVAFAKDVYEVPPRNITVAFEKPFNTTASALGLPGDRCAYYGLPPGCTIFWDDGTCEDMESITREVFEAGIARGQAIRAGTATP